MVKTIQSLFKRAKWNSQRADIFELNFDVISRKVEQQKLINFPFNRSRLTKNHKI